MKSTIRFFCILLTLGIFTSIAAPMSAQSVELDMGPAAKFFTDMPLSVMEFINKNRRLDMLDYYAADSIHRVPNGMEGFSFLEKVTPDYLKAQITPQSTMEICVLPIKNDTIYQCIYTLSTQDQANDSEIKFYTSDYTPLETSKYIRLPQLKDFINQSSMAKNERKDIMQRIEGLLPFTTITFASNPANKSLNAQLTSEQLCPPAEFDRIRKYITPSITYNWTGTKYNLSGNK